jgi:Glycosyl hydrolase family 63 C-terminal domain
MCYHERNAMEGSAERDRLRAAYDDGVPWLRWGPYLSERQWGTVREDYSPDGDAWSYLSHDQARSRAYRWGEDGLAGISDEEQRLCFAFAFWNGVDPILKERAFGLTNSEGNHGEDVKEYYFFLDSTPSHSWMRWRYKYPQQPFPYADLVATNRARSRQDFEYELLDTGVFDDDRYFDIDVTYAKAAPDELLIEVSATNRGAAVARLDVLPTLWFRHTWDASSTERPSLVAVPAGPGGATVVRADEHALGTRWLLLDGHPDLLFTDNESAGQTNGTATRGFTKDAFHHAIVDGRPEALAPDGRGTKSAGHYRFEVPAGAERSIRLRLTAIDPGSADAARAWGSAPFGATFDEVLDARSAEADAFYAALTPPGTNPERAAVLRQALAGMLWSKQYYEYDVRRWLEEHRLVPESAAPGTRNAEWLHLVNADILSMPDTWEYPWFAAWDLAFHTVALGLVDPDFAKAQLRLLLRELDLHPNGQLPAYEWNFSDVNPPVHAWACLFAFGAGQGVTRDDGDLEFLAEAFQKLALNFSWWVNRKDARGRNVYQGGFLGLDNIGLFDRSAPLPLGGTLEQADGTAWMAFYALNMLEMTLELSDRDPAFAEMAVKFAQHFFAIAAAMDRVGDQADELWDETDGFFYDVLRFPDGGSTRLRVRSMVGLISVCAVAVVPGTFVQRFPEHAARIRAMLERQPDLLVNLPSPYLAGQRGRRLLAVMDERKLRRVLARMLDPEEFLSPYGIRSLSKAHASAPVTFDLGGQRHTVEYAPAESPSGMFGGNSNWRGPVWFPINLLIIRALLAYYRYYGDDVRIECPTGSGVEMTLYEVARDLAERLISIFLPDPDGRRPVFGGTARFSDDPHWRDLVLFFEYFHGDDGAGLGASHQTGWTGLVSYLIWLFGSVDAETVLEFGSRAITPGPGDQPTAASATANG